jgi:hypothetical protein
MPSEPDPTAQSSQELYAPDRVWGLVIIILSVILGFCSGAGLFEVGLSAALGGGGATRAGHLTDNGQAAAGTYGFGLAVLGIVLSLLGVYAGYLVMLSRRLGFALVAAVFAFSILMNLGELRHPIQWIFGIPFIVFDGVFLWFALSRILGKKGPPPIS